MLTVYWLCFAAGGVFVLMAVLSGVDGADFADHDFEVHVDHDVELDVELAEQQSPDSPFRSPSTPWYSVFSIVKTLKFWTFAICFFGLTGLVLSHLTVKLPASLIAMMAIAMGIICGSLVAGSLRWLRRRPVDSLVRANDLVGLTGTVEVPFDKTSRGKVRLLVKGTMIDMIANTDEEKALQTGDRVLVVGTEQNRLWVVPDQESAGRLLG